MASINNNPAASFVWDQRNLILPVALYAPLAYQVGSLAYKAIKNPEAVEQKAREFKKSLVDSVTARPEETPAEFRKRLLKNVLKALGVAILLAGACAFPIIFLPAGFGLPVALIAIGLSILFVKNVGNMGGSIAKAKASFIDAFTRRAEETEAAARLRILKNVGKALLAVALVTAIALVASYLIPIVIHTVSLMQASPWNVLAALPGQTPLVVFLEYAAVGIAHLILAARAFYNREWVKGLMHLLNGILSFVFPLQDLLVNGATGMRLHHSFTGLLLQLMPLDSLKMFGAFVTFDSALYWFSSARGFINPLTDRFNNYDFMNIFVEHWKEFLTMLTAASVIQVVSDDFSGDDKKGGADKTAKPQIV